MTVVDVCAVHDCTAGASLFVRARSGTTEDGYCLDHNPFWLLSLAHARLQREDACRCEGAVECDAHVFLAACAGVLQDGLA